MRRFSTALMIVSLLASARPVPAAEILEDLTPLDPFVLRTDPSARSQAMAGASGAVFWGDAHGWANPALLALARGVRYDLETTRYAFGFDHRTRRAVAGWGGLGVAAGRPLGAGEFGGQVGVGGLVLSLDEEIDSWGVAVNLPEVVATMSRLGGGSPTFTRFGDVAIGINRKSYRGRTSATDAWSEAEAIDWGLLVRTGMAFRVASSRCGVDLAYGYSVQNADAAEAAEPLPPSRPYRHGSAIRVHADPPMLLERRRSLGLQPLASLGGAWDRVFWTYRGRRLDDAALLGLEVGLADIAFFRIGGNSRGNRTPFGYGFAMPIGRVARVRYDHAVIPIDEVRDPTTDSWSVWLDPLAIAEAWARREP